MMVMAELHDFPLTNRQTKVLSQTRVSLAAAPHLFCGPEDGWLIGVVRRQQDLELVVTCVRSFGQRHANTPRALRGIHGDSVGCQRAVGLGLKPSRLYGGHVGDDTVHCRYTADTLQMAADGDPRQYLGKPVQLRLGEKKKSYKNGWELTMAVTPH